MEKVKTNTCATIISLTLMLLLSVSLVAISGCKPAEKKESSTPSVTGSSEGSTNTSSTSSNDASGGDQSGGTKGTSADSESLSIPSVPNRQVDPERFPPQ